MSYRAYDPNQLYDTSSIYPPGLKVLYDDRKNTYDELRVDRYKTEEKLFGMPDLSYLSVEAYSPVELQIADPKGNISGYDDKNTGVKLDVPYSNYNEELLSSTSGDDINDHDPPKVLYIDKPTAGNHVLKIFGTGSGP